jgi:hypothetical protein
MTRFNHKGHKGTPGKAKHIAEFKGYQKPAKNEVKRPS